MNGEKDNMHLELPEFLDRKHNEVEEYLEKKHPALNMLRRGRPKKGVVPFDEYSLIADRYRLGHGLKEIAADNGVTQREITRILREQDVPIRKRGRRGNT